MKLVTFKLENQYRLGLFANNLIYDLNKINSKIPADILSWLNEGQTSLNLTKNIENDILNKKNTNGYSLNEIEICAPVPNPVSCRDGYAFRQHVEAARRNRGVAMIEEFDQYPIFYFTNHNAINGPGQVWCMPDHFEKLDFELEVAVVIGKKGRNIKAAEADNYIAGFMIMNDLSARTLQMEEMLLNLGPAKGKDFSTIIGPWLVTPDELEKYKVECRHGHIGNSYNIEMKCRVNGIEVSRGNMKDMDWTFAEIIERCSYGVDIFPGDVIGSGTVGTGCFLELNGTGLLNNPSYKTQWLNDGDVVEMEITGLGILNNTIRKEKTDYSILKLKKDKG
ncbi:MAG: fumarylacetoacetate hydrolase family protein [Bacteroidetes bacterium]|nr:fumarylacetoacetate hydrolase family protein [Bacteroidota bacterium]